MFAYTNATSEINRENHHLAAYGSEMMSAPSSTSSICHDSSQNVAYNYKYKKKYEWFMKRGRDEECSEAESGVDEANSECSSDYDDDVNDASSFGISKRAKLIDIDMNNTRKADKSDNVKLMQLEEERKFKRKADHDLKDAMLGVIKKPAIEAAIASASSSSSSLSAVEPKVITIVSNFESKSTLPPPPSPSASPAISATFQSINSCFTNRNLPLSSDRFNLVNNNNSNIRPSNTIQDTQQQQLILKAALAVKTQVKMSIVNLYMMRKENILNLIERNRYNQILAPFDLVAHSRLKAKTSGDSSSSSKSTYNTNPKSLNSLHLDFSNLNLNCARERGRSSNVDNSDLTNIYNIGFIKKLSKLDKFYRPTDKNYLKQNGLLPNCASSYLMPYFFDIFKASELQSFSKETIDMLLLLKKSYRPQERMDYELATGYYVENILWNCFALYNFRFDDTLRTRMGFLNYYLSYIYLMYDFEKLAQYDQRSNARMGDEKSYSKKYAELKSILPFLLEALVLNGLFKSSDLVQFQKFYMNRRLSKAKSLSVMNHELELRETIEESDPTSSLENHYIDSSMKQLLTVEDMCYPLKLKDICRIAVKKSLKTYSTEALGKLNVPKSVQSFLAFDDEMKNLVYCNKSLIDSNNQQTKQSSSQAKPKCSWY